MRSSLLSLYLGVFENSLKREISNETAAMIVELARRFALESNFQTRPNARKEMRFSRWLLVARARKH
jgi:hypothetical protein